MPVSSYLVNVSGVCCLLGLEERGGKGLVLFLPGSLVQSSLYMTGPAELTWSPTSPFLSKW